MVAVGCGALPVYAPTGPPAPRQLAGDGLVTAP